MSNFTVDDTAATLLYGPGWGVYSPKDPDLGKYFQSTYHASQTAGAYMNVTFAGTALYLYGSKGPDRGNFSVRYDNFIEPLSAYAGTRQYQQLLFSTILPRNTHTVTLTNTGGGWVDLDFAIFTDGSNVTAPTGVSSTISPLPIPSSSTPTVPVPSHPPAQVSPATAASDSASSGTTLILAILFGVLLFFLLAFAAVYTLRRRRQRLHPKPPLLPPGSHDAPQSTRSAGSVFLIGHNNFAVSPEPPYNQTISNAPHSPQQSTITSPFSHSHSHSHSHSNFNTNYNAEEPEMRQTQTQTAGRPWSPFRALWGRGGEVADSMRSTFLKV